jgi:hypothetical protein
VTRPDHNNDPAYLKGYARLMLAMARKYRGTAGAIVWIKAARDARRRASEMAGMGQGELAL